MSAHRTLNDMFRAFDPKVGPGILKDPGDAGTITPTMWGQICSVVTTAAQTRTLAQPTKPGVLVTVVLDTDAGDLTLTVTGGYNNAVDTAITLADAGDFVQFLSVEVGTSYLWRIVGQEGAAFTVAAEHGAGFISTAFAPITSRREENGTIITEIKFDLDGFAVQGDTGKDVIGLSATAAAYFGKYVVATCGICYRLEVVCIVLPTQQTATISLDLDIGADDQSLAQNATADDVVLDIGTVQAGNVYIDNIPNLTDGDYLYLIEGAGTTGATGEYSGGQFIVRLLGHPVMT